MAGVQLEDLLAALRTDPPRTLMNTGPRDAGGRLRGKALERHNVKKYREKGWHKGKDGVWRPPNTSGRSYSAYAPDQGGPPPRPGSSQEQRANRLKPRKRRKQRPLYPHGWGGTIT